MQSFKKHSGSKSQVEIKKGDIPVQLNDDFENHFEFGIEAALQDFGVLKCKIVNIAMDELRKGLQQPKKRKHW